MRQISEGLIAGGCGECVQELQRAFSRNFRRPASRFGIPFRPAATATCRCQRSFAPTDIYHPTPSWTASTPINHHDRFRTSADPKRQISQHHGARLRDRDLATLLRLSGHTESASSAYPGALRNHHRATRHHRRQLVIRRRLGWQERSIWSTTTGLQGSSVFPFYCACERSAHTYTHRHTHRLESLGRKHVPRRLATRSILRGARCG